MGNNTSVLDIYGDYKDLDINYGMTSQDYFVHMLRFSKMTDMVRGKNIFDLGCGKYTNLLKAICQMQRGPNYNCYIGTDYCKCRKWRPDYKGIWDKTYILDEMDFTDDDNFLTVLSVLETVYSSDEPFIITCFEVLEHMDFKLQNKFLYNLSRILHNPLFRIEACYFSTPNFNGSAANNHISELHYTLLEEMFERYDIKVVNAQGLSAWKKYCVQQNLGPGVNPPNNLAEMPSAIQKMVWGYALHRKYSNNILYTIASGDKTLEDFNALVSKEFVHDGYRQGGDKAYLCSNPF